LYGKKKSTVNFEEKRGGNQKIKNLTGCQKEKACRNCQET